MTRNLNVTIIFYLGIRGGGQARADNTGKGLGKFSVTDTFSFSISMTENFAQTDRSCRHMSDVIDWIISKLTHCKIKQYFGGELIFPVSDYCRLVQASN